MAYIDLAYIDFSDDQSATSEVGSSVSHLPGDFDAHADGGQSEVCLRPVLTDNNLKEFTDGEWSLPLHGNGDKEAAGGPIGNLGVLAGNWGGDWKDPASCDYMKADLKRGPCSIIMLQEASQALLAVLKADGGAGITAMADPDTRGDGVKLQERPTSEYIG